MSKNDAINIMNGSNLVDKRGVLFFLLLLLLLSLLLLLLLLYIKISESTDLTYYQRNRDVIINRAKYYYENDKKY